MSLDLRPDANQSGEVPRKDTFPPSGGADDEVGRRPVARQEPPKEEALPAGDQSEAPAGEVVKRPIAPVPFLGRLPKPTTAGTKTEAVNPIEEASRIAEAARERSFLTPESGQTIPKKAEVSQGEAAVGSDAPKAELPTPSTPVPAEPVAPQAEPSPVIVPQPPAEKNLGSSLDAAIAQRKVEPVQPTPEGSTAAEPPRGDETTSAALAADVARSAHETHRNEVIAETYPAELRAQINALAAVLPPNVEIGAWLGDEAGSEKSLPFFRLDAATGERKELTEDAWYALLAALPADQRDRATVAYRQLKAAINAKQQGLPAPSKPPVNLELQRPTTEPAPPKPVAPEAAVMPVQPPVELPVPKPIPHSEQSSAVEASVPTAPAEPSAPAEAPVSPATPAVPEPTPSTPPLTVPTPPEQTPIPTPQEPPAQPSVPTPPAEPTGLPTTNEVAPQPPVVAEAQPPTTMPEPVATPKQDEPKPEADALAEILGKQQSAAELRGQIEAIAQQMMAKVPGLTIGKLEDTPTGAALSMKYNGIEISGKTLEEAEAKFSEIIASIPDDQVLPEKKQDVIATYKKLPEMMRRYVVVRHTEEQKAKGAVDKSQPGQSGGLWGRIKGLFGRK